MDTGAYIPSSVVASAADIYQEGITIPPMKMVEAGELRVDFFRLLPGEPALRRPDRGRPAGPDRLDRRRASGSRSSCESYGTDVVLRYVDEIIGYSDRRVGQEIASMPDGRYEAEGWIDSDGFGSEHIRVQVAVDDRRRPGAGRLRRLRPAGEGRRQRQLRHLAGGRRGAVPLLHRRRHPAQPRRDRPHRRDRAEEGTDLLRQIPRLDQRRDDRPLRPDAGRGQPGDGRGDAGARPGGRRALRQHPPVRRQRRRRALALGLHALQQRRRRRRRQRQRRLAPLVQPGRPRRDENPADRAARAALPAADRALSRSTPTRSASAAGWAARATSAR